MTRSDPTLGSTNSTAAAAAIDRVRVAIDTGPLYGHRSGIGVATEGMIAALAERLDVALCPYLVSYRASPTPGHRRLPLPGIVAAHVWSRSNHPNARRWLGDVDVVHGTNYVAPPTGLPTVISVYDTWFFDHPELAHPGVRRAGQVLRRAVDRGAFVHVTSQSTAANVTRILGTDRVRVAYLGLPSHLAASHLTGSPGEIAETATNAEGVNENDRDRGNSELERLLELSTDGHEIIAAVGTEERRKDLPLLIEAFGLVGDDESADPTAHRRVLVIAGAPGDASDAVTDAIARLSPARRALVRRLGPIDNRVKTELLHAARVLAYPSLDEGFGFPILEAQALGVPVVARAVGSIPEVGGDGVALVAERDPVAFASSLLFVLNDDKERQRLVTAGHDNLQRFSWETTARELRSIYQAAIENS